MSESEVVVGQIVEFTGYSSIEQDVAPMLEEGQRVRVTEIKEGDDIAYSVRPVDENDEFIGSDGDQIFEDEFEVIVEEPAKEPAKKVTKKAKNTEETAEALTDLVASRQEMEAGEEPLMAEEGFEHDAIIAEMIRGTNDVTNLAYSLYAEHEELYYKLGGVLLDIKEKKAHVSQGYEDSSYGFVTYIKDKIGPDERHCYYLISIYKKFRKAGISITDLRGIGWTKARLLLTVDDDEVKEWLEEAKTKTRQELEEDIKNSKEHVDSETIRKTRYTFTLYGEAATLAQQAIDHAKSQVEEGDANKAFEYICTQYLILETDVQVENGEDHAEGYESALDKSEEHKVIIEEDITEELGGSGDR